MSKSKSFVGNSLLLALPVAAQMLLQSFLGMIDVMMVAPLGESAIAAVGLAAKIQFLLLVLMSGFATGGAVLVAQYMGANDFKNCQRTLAVTLVVGLSIIIPLMFVIGFAAPFWVQWITPDHHVANLAATFLVITAPALVFTQIIVIYEASLRSLGQTTMPLMAGMIAAVVNVLLNYLLITGNCGFPALGVAGAAWATLTARIVQLLFIVLWVYSKKHGFALSVTQLKWGFDGVQLKRYLAFALPLVANYGIWAVGNATYHIATGFAGTNALAVMGMIVPIESTFFALFIGLGNASSVLIGRALGANDRAEAWKLQQFFSRLTLLLTIALPFLLWLSRSLVIPLFGALTQHTSELLTQTLTIFCILAWLKVFNFMRIVGVLRAGGDNKFCLALDIVVMWCIGIPVYVLAVFLGGFNFTILFIFMYLEDALKFIPAMLRIKSKKWMNNLAR
jgi:putative MATE family efflux protein